MNTTKDILRLSLECNAVMKVYMRVQVVTLISQKDILFSRCISRAYLVFIPWDISQILSFLCKVS